MARLWEDRDSSSRLCAHPDGARRAGKSSVLRIRADSTAEWLKGHMVAGMSEAVRELVPIEVEVQDRGGPGGEQ